MTFIQSFKSQLSQFSQSFKHLGGDQHSTLSRLCSLADEKVFGSNSNKEIDFFSKKYDIALRLFSFYDNKGCKWGVETLNHAGLQLFSGLLYLRVLLAINQNASDIDLAKYINVCWKAFDNVNLPDFLQTEPKRLQYLQDELFERLPAKDLQDKAISPYTVTNIKPIDWDGFKTLPIDILFYEGPIVRAYLETLYSLKCKPRRIIHLIAERDLVSKKKVGRFMPSFFRHKYAAAIQSRKIHYWPQYLFRTHKKCCLEIFEHLQEILKIEQATLLGVVDLKPLDHYSDSVISLPFTSLNDQKMLEFISRQNVSMYLFTGGGIVPGSFFNLKNMRFLHIHPGYLPDIRGADCLLWSTMLAGYPSATCFYLNPGIDTGEVINAAFLPKIALPDLVSDLDEKMIYRLLYSFIDPWVRSVVLRDTLSSTNYLQNITASPQSIEAGTNFHFMHQNIQNAVIKNVFIKNNEQVFEETR